MNEHYVTQRFTNGQEWIYVVYVLYACAAAAAASAGCSGWTVGAVYVLYIDCRCVLVFVDKM